MVQSTQRGHFEAELGSVMDGGNFAAITSILKQGGGKACHWITAGRKCDVFHFIGYETDYCDVAITG